jgi:glycerol-3-phosphate dehydrogenase
VFFILPWNGLTLIGTTDTAYSGDPGGAKADADDFAYLLEAARDALPAAAIDETKIVSTFAGIRPLLRSNARHPSAASREHSITENPPGLISVLGGKFTTFRAIAEQAVDSIVSELGGPIKPCRTADLPFPGATALPVPPATSEPSGMRALSGVYGSRTGQVLEAATNVAGAFEPLCPHTARTRAEVAHAVRNEMALTLEDILERRLGISHTAPCRGADAVEEAARIAAPLLGWTGEKTAGEIADYRKGT